MSENTHSPLPLTLTPKQTKQCWMQVSFSPLDTRPKLLERVALPTGKPWALAVPGA